MNDLSVGAGKMRLLPMRWIPWSATISAWKGNGSFWHPFVGPDGNPNYDSIMHCIYAI